MMILITFLSLEHVIGLCRLGTSHLWVYSQQGTIVNERVLREYEDPYIDNDSTPRRIVKLNNISGVMCGWQCVKSGQIATCPQCR